MNEEQQIEEMAKIMCGNDCEECAKESAEFYNQTLEEARNNKCLLKNCAKTLYEQGYRKLPDGATVLLVGENNRALDEKTIEYFVKHNEQIRKETAEKILDLLVPDCKACDENWHSGCLCLRATLAEKIAKQFGVGVEE